MDVPQPMPGFPLTRRTLVDAIRSDDAAARASAFSLLVEAYWKPVYKYVRLRHRLARETAEDLTQSFFQQAHERGFLAGYDPTRARFRTFLRVALDRLASKLLDHEHAQKRGGGIAPIPLSFADAEGEVVTVEPVAESESERFFEKEWRRALVEAALSSLREECARTGRVRRYEMFARVALPAAEAPSYAELAREHGIEIHTVTNELAAARREFRRILLDRLRAVTTSEEEFQEELRALLGDAAR